MDQNYSRNNIIILQQEGFSIIELPIAIFCLLFAILVFAASVLMVAQMNRSVSNKMKNKEYIREQLQLISNSIWNGPNSKNLTSFIQFAESTQNKFNPILQTNLNDPAVMLNKFNVVNNSTVTIQGCEFKVTYKFDMFKFDKADPSFNPIPIVLGTDSLLDLAYLKAVVDLHPVDACNTHVTVSPESTHGEIYIAK